ncbi:integrin alpha-11-like [Carassius auratus]|uniref:Integrin alpha-11-like n=1 Tax=Carassius auratus TaxID=7957 RepID=A0A6P6MCR1_CARAU|nr:integrin alpha-11-like [Carassius auratus]
MEYTNIFLLWITALMPGQRTCFNIDTRHAQIIEGSKEAQFGYTVQQHEADGGKWLLVGAPFESSGEHQTGDVYRCPLDSKPATNCTRLHLGKISLNNVSERKEKMRMGMTLTSNPKDNSFVACGPLWSYECGSSYYSTGICSRVNSSFSFTHSIAPAFQRCETYMDIVIVLDGSNSIYPWFEVQDFLINVLQKFYVGPGQIQVGVVQYGARVVHEFRLDDFRTVEEVVEAAKNIDQRGGEETRTALAINEARTQAFKHGGRPEAKRVMIVITDGESHDSPNLRRAVEDSEKDNITLYAIAVLGSYNRRGINPEAFLREIKFIASDPEEHFFSVTDESALKDIVDALGEKIFSLEGTNQNGTAFGLQMSQAGFSSHVVEDGILLGAVGAYDWNGAVLKETRHGKVIPAKSSYIKEFPEELKNHGAYLGYMVSSVVSAQHGQLYVAGAPRFNHTGKIIIFTLTNSGNLTILYSLYGQQIGSYYGSELAPIDLNNDGLTDLLLVGAPMYFYKGWEKGRVYIYILSLQGSYIPDGTLGPSEKTHDSRFGAAMSALPDLNGDGFTELVVGAPLEDDHKGAIYLFYGKQDRIQPKYKQRIAAGDVSPGLRYFGRSVHGMMDVNGDELIDLSVGSLGAVVLLWSRSVVRVGISVHFEPSKINVFNKDCTRGGREVSCMLATVCLNVTARTPMTDPKTVALRYSFGFEESRYFPRAVLDSTEEPQPRDITLQPDSDYCQQVYFHVHEVTDYTRPLTFTVNIGLQSTDEGPVLDDSWPTSLQSELPFWNGCDDDDECVPSLVLQSSSDLLDRRQFCEQHERSSWPPCVHQRTRTSGERLVEASRRKVLVETRLENQGENAYGTVLHITHSPNLQFSSLLLKAPSDITIACPNSDDTSLYRSCNVSAPFLRSHAQVYFRLEFEFNRSIFLNYVQITLKVSSEGEELSPEDNINDIYHNLKYEADILFTRDSSPSRFDLKPGFDQSLPVGTGPPFNISYQIQNLGVFPVSELLFTLNVFAVTRNANTLLRLSDLEINQTAGSSCALPRVITVDSSSQEDLSLNPLTNTSTEDTLLAHCRISLAPRADVSITATGSLNLQTLFAVKLKRLDLIMTAAVEMNPSSPMFLHEERPLRHIILEIRKEEDYRIPVWVIIGSTLGGLQLLALLVLALWKLGFFHRQKRKREEQATNEKTAEVQ